MVMSGNIPKLIRMPQTLVEHLQAWADEEHRSVPNLVVHLLWEAVRQRQRQQAA